MSLLFHMLSRFVTAFLPRSKHLLISGLQSRSAVILEPKVCHCFHFFPIYSPWSDGTRCHDLHFWMFNFKSTFSLFSSTFFKRLFSFEHHFTSVWDECNSVVVWAFFGIAFLWDWKENWPFPVLWPLLNFPKLLAYWVQTFTASSFRIWNSSTGIPSPPLALFVVMLSEAHLASHSKMSGSRLVITSSWLSGSWRSFLYTIIIKFP